MTGSTKESGGDGKQMRRRRCQAEEEEVTETSRVKKDNGRLTYYISFSTTVR